MRLDELKLALVVVVLLDAGDMVRPPAARDLFLKDQDHSIFSLITFS
jgi:hypothetical protein